nr:SDR family NAD(P)-dependent oxidoreductase [Halogeometricum sp. CBA1124]
MTEDVAEPDLYDSLSGQVALVTGANRGIGREIAEQLHDLGATVFAATRSMTHEIPDEWEHLLVDVTQEGEISDAVDDIFASAGRLDILVNTPPSAAATVTSSPSRSRTSTERWRRTSAGRCSSASTPSLSSCRTRAAASSTSPPGWAH